MSSIIDSTHLVKVPIMASMVVVIIRLDDSNQSFMDLSNENLTYYNYLFFEFGFIIGGVGEGSSILQG